MYEYSVQSGPLKITIVAETAYDAAVEAVRWWGRRAKRNHRRALDEVLAVRERGQRIWNVSLPSTCSPKPKAKRPKLPGTG